MWTDFLFENYKCISSNKQKSLWIVALTAISLSAMHKVSLRLVIAWRINNCSNSWETWLHLWIQVWTQNQHDVRTVKWLIMNQIFQAQKNIYYGISRLTNTHIHQGFQMRIKNNLSVEEREILKGLKIICLLSYVLLIKAKLLLLKIGTRIWKRCRNK